MTPGEQVTNDSEVNVDSDRAAVYRSACMRQGDLTLDGREMQLVAKRCARGMNCPTKMERC